MNNRFLRTAYAVTQIALVLVSYLWYRLITYRFIGKGKRREALDRVHERQAKRLFITFSRLRGAYIKLAQFLSTQAILPPPYLIEFAKMQDQVAPVPFSAFETRLVAELGPDWRKHFNSVSEQPLASASIAQVHRAELTDGRQVVLKVQYPGLETFFTKDLQLISSMLPWYIKAIQLTYPELRSGIDHNAMIRELFGYIERELDYENELVYQKKMAGHFAEWKSVIVPTPVEELCTRHLLCMDYIEGKRILEWFDGAPQEDRDMVFETFVDFALYTWVVKGTFQSDSHPGNFLITPDEKLVLLDFGCIKELKPEFRRGVLKVVQSYLNRDPRGAAEVLQELGFRTQVGTTESLQKWVEYGYALTDMILEHFKHGHDLVAHMNKNLADLSKQFIAINSEHRIAHVPEEYMLLGRALATPPIPLDKYKPQVDVIPLALEHLAAADEELNS